jgi:hypothetical protein
MLHFLAGFPAGYDGYPYYLYVVSPELPETGKMPLHLPARYRFDGQRLPPDTVKEDVYRSFTQFIHQVKKRARVQ